MPKPARMMSRRIPIWKCNAFGTRRNALQNWSDKHTSNQILKLKLLQKLFKIQPQGVHMASKIYSGGLLGGQTEKNMFLKPSRTPQGPPLGAYLEVQNRSKTLFEVTCVLETLPGRVWNDFGLPNSFPKEVLEAFSRPPKTYSFHLGLPGGLWNGFWKPFGPLGARFWSISGGHFSFKIWSEVCLSLQFCIAFRPVPNALNFYMGIHSRYLSCRFGHPWPKGRLLSFFFQFQVRALSVTVHSFYM